MNVWAVTMMRDEVDIAAASLWHMVSQGVDGIVVADNLSADGTKEAIRSVQREATIPILLIEDLEEGYYQGQKMTRLAEIAAGQGAEWIIPFDADELWRGQSHLLADILGRAEGRIFGIASFTYIETGYDLPGETPFERMVYRRPNPTTYPKVCYRYDSKLIIHQGNDGLCALDGGLLSFPTLDSAVARIHHFPHRSPEQFIKKMRNGAAAMKAAADLPASYCAHWRAYGRLLDLYGEEALRIIYFSSFFCGEPWREGLVLDPAWRPGPTSSVIP
ncbi:MAG TPA: glycosyltransferase family 2 protein [Thermoanaerobaculia bacterium]|nr:glycosyltransferase family 2 protein [Thermoanaerobaculia bacterium]